MDIRTTVDSVHNASFVYILLHYTVWRINEGVVVENRPCLLHLFCSKLYRVQISTKVTIAMFLPQLWEMRSHKDGLDSELKSCRAPLPQIMLGIVWGICSSFSTFKAELSDTNDISSLFLLYLGCIPICHWPPGGYRQQQHGHWERGINTNQWPYRIS